MAGNGKMVRNILKIVLLMFVVLLGSFMNRNTVAAEGKNKTVSWNVYSKTEKSPTPTVEIRQVKQQQIHNKENEYSFLVKNNGADKIKKAVYSYKVTVKVPMEESSVITQEAITVSEGAVTGEEDQNSVGMQGADTVSEGAVTGPEEEGQKPVVTQEAITVSEGAVAELEKVKYKTVTYDVKSVVKDVQPGKCSERIQLKIPVESENQIIKKVTLCRMELYSGNACSIHNYKTGREKVEWARKDVTAPVIYGFVNTNSVNKNVYCKDVFMQIYSDQLSGYKFKNYIKVADNRTGIVKVQLDLSPVDLGKEGFYKVRVSAQDKAGNTAETYTWIQLLIPGSAEAIADDILPRITRQGDSDVTKARAIYSYIRGNCHYSESGGKGNWRNIALNAFRYRSGDCYSFYSMARLLCTRAQIPCISITREGGYHHWWDLVYVNGGWYHFDTTPRASGGSFCLMTDSQMAGYNREGSNPFTHTKEFYPKVSEYAISSNP